MKKILTILLISFTTAIYAQSKPISSLPFSVENNSIYILCKVNETDSLKVLFDTGANGSVINKSSLHKVKLIVSGKSINEGSNGQNEVEISTKNDVFLGNIHRKNVSFAIIDFEDETFDGIIGTDLMNGYIIQIDYHKKSINFFDKNDNNFTYKGYTKLKLYSDDFYPTYVKSKVIIANKKYKGFFGLDTGADDALTITSPFAKKNDFINKTIQVGTSTSQGSDGSEYEMPIVLLPEIEFAEKHLYRIPTALSNATEGIDAKEKLAGFVGNGFLSKFNIILDYDNRNIYFKLNNNLYKKYFE